MKSLLLRAFVVAALLGCVGCTVAPDPDTSGQLVGQVLNIQPGYRSGSSYIGLKFGDGQTVNFHACQPEGRVEVGKTYEIHWRKYDKFFECHMVDNIKEIK